MRSEHMNFFVNVATIILLILAGLNVFVGPFMIGKERKPTTADVYVIQLLISGLVIIVSGRVLGWW